jgi:hypothetical protein
MRHRRQQELPTAAGRPGVGAADMIGDVRSSEEKEHVMSARHLPAAAAAALLGVFSLATPAAAHVLVQPAAAGTGLTAGRAWSAVAVLLGLVGVVTGGLALARSPGRAGTGRRAVIVAPAAGLGGAVIGGLVVAAAEGGPGTGYGIVGGFVALVVGLIAMVLGGLALARYRRLRLSDLPKV